MQKYVVVKNLFFCGMSLIIASRSGEPLLLGWEVIGLGSMALISFWISRLSTLKSALKSLLINKIGDFSLFFL